MNPFLLIVFVFVIFVKTSAYSLEVGCYALPCGRGVRYHGETMKEAIQQAVQDANENNLVFFTIPAYMAETMALGAEGPMNIKYHYYDIVTKIKIPSRFYEMFEFSPWTKGIISEGIKMDVAEFEVKFPHYYDIASSKYAMYYNTTILNCLLKSPILQDTHINPDSKAMVLEFIEKIIVKMDCLVYDGQSKNMKIIEL